MRKSYMLFLLSFVMVAAVAWLSSVGPQTVFASQSNTVSVSVGPIAVPNVPVSVCVNSNCVSTPSLSSVSLSATVTADTTAGTPSVTTGSCPTIGAVLTVSTGGTSATVSGTVTGTLPDGSSFSQAVGPTTVPGLSSVTISVCAQ